MNRGVILLVAVAACDGWRPGTQIGVESAGERCVLVSSSGITNRDEIPKGFDQSPQASLDAHVGQYDGFRYGENEEPTAVPMQLSVVATAEPFTLEEYALPPGAFSTPGYRCPALVRVDVDVRFGTEGLQFEGRVPLTVDDTGSAVITWAASLPAGTGLPEGFTEIPPAPFDVAQAEEVTAVLQASRWLEQPWWVDVGWRHAIVTDEGPDEGHESVVWGSVGP